MVPVVSQFTMKGARTLDFSFQGGEWPLVSSQTTERPQSSFTHIVPPALPGTAFTSNVEDIVKEAGSRGRVQVTSDLSAQGPPGDRKGRVRWRDDLPRYFFRHQWKSLPSP